MIVEGSPAHICCALVELIHARSAHHLVVSAERAQAVGGLSHPHQVGAFVEEDGRTFRIILRRAGIIVDAEERLGIRASALVVAAGAREGCTAERDDLRAPLTLLKALGVASTDVECARVPHVLAQRRALRGDRLPQSRQAGGGRHLSPSAG
eukprot:scaffold256445_cov44-Tisochrysis_lutea.AAC.1